MYLGLTTMLSRMVGQVMSKGCGVLRLARATVQPNIFSSYTSDLPTFPTTSMETSRLLFFDVSMASISPICMKNRVTLNWQKLGLLM